MPRSVYSYSYLTYYVLVAFSCASVSRQTTNRSISYPAKRHREGCSKIKLTPHHIYPRAHTLPSVHELSRHSQSKLWGLRALVYCDSNNTTNLLIEIEKKRLLLVAVTSVAPDSCAGRLRGIYRALLSAFTTCWMDEAGRCSLSPY